jgi:DNA replication and repair protein RecF
LYLKSIILYNFKSYHQAEFQFSARLNVIYGINGVGKTNLLDAIHMLAMTRSAFSVTDQQLIREEEDFLRLQGQLVKDSRTVKIVIKLPRNKKKIIERDDSAVTRPVDHVGLMPVVMITPDDLNLVNGSSSERRKLADSTLSQVDDHYLEHLILYNRLLKQRNSLLKGWHEQGNYDPVLLDTYDNGMTGPAKAIYQQRKIFFDQLSDRIQYYYNILCDGREEVHLTYRSALAQASFRDLSRQHLSRDRLSCRTNAGIHRDTIDCLIKGRDARIFGSQGQKKSLVFAIRLAQLDYMVQRLNDQPVLLLDDVFDKLDQERVNRLLSIILSNSFGQIFVTDTQWERIGMLLESYDIDVKKIEIRENGHTVKHE